MTTNIVSNTSESEKNEWRTPPEVFAWASSLLGGINFDTACNDYNALARPVWSAHGSRDALQVHWSGRLFCNCPYDNIDAWASYSISMSRAITALLIPSPNGEARYAELCAKAHEIQIIGRLAFLKPDGTPVSGNTRGSSLFIINGYGQGSRSFITRDEIFARFGR